MEAELEPDDVARLRAKWDQVDAELHEAEMDGSEYPGARLILGFVKDLLDDSEA